MDRFEAMSLLLAVIDAGNMSAASRRLAIPLTTVSRKISALEARLGARLLIRSSRGIALTEAGSAYVAACRRILEEVGEAERTASGEYRQPKGHLVITAPIVFGRLHVLPVVAAFLKTYPEIAIRLMLADRVVNLMEEQIDVAVRIGGLPDSSLTAVKVGEIRRVTCASPFYLAARGLPESPSDLAAHDCISFEGLTSSQTWRFRGGRADIAVPIRSRLIVNTAEAAVDAAKAGLGITRVLSYQVTDAKRGGKLTAILEAFEPAPWPVSLVHGGQSLLPLKTRAFLDFAVPRLRASILADAE